MIMTTVQPVSCTGLLFYCEGGQPQLKDHIVRTNTLEIKESVKEQSQYLTRAMYLISQSFV